MAPFAAASENTVKTLRDGLDSKGTTGAILTQRNALSDDVEIWLYGPGCTYKSIDYIPAYLRAAPSSLHYTRPAKPIKPSQLVRDLLALGIRPSKAAMLAGVNRSLAYREKELQQKRGVCPCCGRLMPNR